MPANSKSSTPNSPSGRLGWKHSFNGWAKSVHPLLTHDLDLRALTPSQLRQLAAAYDRLCEQALLPLPQMNEYGTRIQIDQAIGDVLNLPDLTPLRQILARKPVVCLRRL